MCLALDFMKEQQINGADGKRGFHAAVERKENLTLQTPGHLSLPRIFIKHLGIGNHI